MTSVGDYQFCASALISLADKRNDHTSDMVRAVANDILNKLNAVRHDLPVMLLALDKDDARAVGQAIVDRRTAPLPDYDSNENGCLLAEICRGWMEFMDLSKGENPRWVTGHSEIDNKPR